MVEHIFPFRWTGEAAQEAIDGAVAELCGLKGKIAGIADLSCGANFLRLLPARDKRGKALDRHKRIDEGA